VHEPLFGSCRIAQHELRERDGVGGIAHPRQLSLALIRFIR
jgi:hypothetical protein